LVLPRTQLEPYNQTLIGASPATRTEWAAQVARQLREAFPDLTEVVFLAGRDYRYPLEALLSATGVACSAPMQGLGLGQQKQWLMRNPTVYHGTDATFTAFSTDNVGKAHGMGVLALRSPSTYYIPAVVAAVCVAFMAGAKR
jgi:hypothetical protein